MRRDLLDQLLAYRVSSAKRIVPERKASEASFKVSAPALPSKLVVAATIEQIKAAVEAGALDIAAYPWYRGKQYVDLKSLETLAIENPEVRFYLRASSILKGEFDMVLASVRRLVEGGHIRGVLTSNMGLIRALKGVCPVIGDYKLNLFNSSSLDIFGDDICGGTVSEELNRSELKELKGKERLMCILYGKQELMHSEYCPVGAAVGGMTREKACNQACMRESYSLKDRMGEEFRVMTDWFCRSFIMNSKPKNILDTANDLKWMGFSSFRMDLTTESHDESLELVSAFLGERAFSTSDFNRGHYKRGVE
jgi:putative protease